MGVVDTFWQVWEGLLGVLGAALAFFHGIFAVVPVLDIWAWGWAIIVLTLVVRVILLPLAIKQTKSMRAMQAIQPEIKKIQQKYKVDRSLMKTDPEKFRAKRQKQQEEMMKLYREHNANPAMSCLPILPQIPIFIGMFHLLGGRPGSDPEVEEIGDAGFFLIEDLTARASDVMGGGLGLIGAGGIVVLVLLMGVTMWFSQRQMMKNNPASSANPQMKIMMYVMPIGITVIAVNFPAGLVLYWLTTNLWTIVQQHLMFHKFAPPAAKAST
jgi:YidC/Oxa1 family membrane protein insertase